MEIDGLTEWYDDDCHPVCPATLAHVRAPLLLIANFAAHIHSSVPWSHDEDAGEKVEYHQASRVRYGKVR